MRKVRTLEEWLENSSYLPRFLRDFHDQKDVFKLIWNAVGYQRTKEPNFLGQMNWIDSHVYTIDCFLRIMAMYGWTLQRAKKKEFDFRDLDERIREYKAEMAEVFRQAWAPAPIDQLISELPKAEEPEPPQPETIAAILKEDE